MPRTTKITTETLIIGAGAAGLAAASELAARGEPCTIVEARDRLGGRIFTDHTSAAIPVELGAEFIHGESAAILDRLRASGDVAIDTGMERWTLRGKKLVDAGDQFEALKNGLRKFSCPEPDISFDALLRRHQRTLAEPVRKFARSLVEGFDAADPARISAREVLAEWSGPAAANGPTFRPARGYGALLQSMHRALPAGLVSCRLGTVVRAVAWHRHEVIADATQLGEPIRYRAQRVIVTVPLGVLQAPATATGSIQFTPELSGKRVALSQLNTGPVIKVILNFTRPFWAEVESQRFRNAAFFFAREHAFPTFWTSLPVRSATLVAWSGGPNAAALAGASEAGILQQVQNSLQSMFGRQDFPAMLQSMCWQDWQGDPYARGAYSYVLTGGAKARQSLARPVANTVFFAGEACDTSGEAGTVAGAFNSGVAAAEQVLRSIDAR